MKDHKPPILPGDQGGLAVAMFIKDGHIVLHFGKDISWLGLHKEDAVALIERLQEMVDQL